MSQQPKKNRRIETKKNFGLLETDKHPNEQTSQMIKGYPQRMRL